MVSCTHTILAELPSTIKPHPHPTYRSDQEELINISIFPRWSAFVPKWELNKRAHIKVYTIMQKRGDYVGSSPARRVHM